MFYRLQAAGALLLLLLASVLGQAGLQHCLCTGHVGLVSSVGSNGCEECCCSDLGEAPQDKHQPSPCEDGSCYVLISFDAVDPPAISLDAPVSVAICPQFFVAAELPALRALTEPSAPRYRPPDPRAVPLTVLFSSFLI